MILGSEKEGRSESRLSRDGPQISWGRSYFTEIPRIRFSLSGVRSGPKTDGGNTMTTENVPNGGQFALHWSPSPT